VRWRTCRGASTTRAATTTPTASSGHLNMGIQYKLWQWYTPTNGWRSDTAVLSASFPVRLQATAVTTSPEDSVTQDSHCPIFAIFLFRWPALLALQDYKLQQLLVASTADLQSQTLQCSDLKKKEKRTIFVLYSLVYFDSYPSCWHFHTVHITIFSFFFIYSFLFACHHTVTIHFLYFHTCVDVTHSHVM
jgi:hypothetical protein